MLCILCPISAENLVFCPEQLRIIHAPSTRTTPAFKTFHFNFPPLNVRFTRWFICIYAGSMSSHAVVTRIWDLFMWHGRRGPAVLVWVALGILHGCRKRMFESKSLPATVKAVRRHAEGCKTFDDLVRQAPVGLNQVGENGTGCVRGLGGG